MLAEQYFVVQTNPQKETFVADRLSDLQPYLPRFKRNTGKIAALFPRYIFCPQIAEVSLITHTVGVCALLMAGDHPAVIKGAVIASWKAKERGGLVQLPPAPRFRPGQRLVITEGSLKYRTVVHAGMSGKDRERVLIDMLGQSVTITVRSAHLASEFRAPPRNRLRLAGDTLMRQQTGRCA